MAPERRIDPEDGGSYTFEELAGFYKGKYKKKAIESYWNDVCQVTKSKAAKAKGKVKAEVKAKGKAEGKKPKEGQEVVDSVVCASWVVPVDTDDVYENYAVATRDGKIVELLPKDQALQKYFAKEGVVNLKGSVLLPGFVNAHTHSPMVFLRGVSDDIALHKWLQDTIWPLEHTFCDHSFVKEGADLAIAEMIRGGTTCFNDMYWFPEAVAEAVKASGIRAVLGIIAIQFPFGAYGTGPDEYIAKGKATREKFLSESRISWTVAPHAPYTVADATLMQLKEVSNELGGLPMHIHLHETSQECTDSINQTPSMSKHQSDEKCTPLCNFNRLGLVDEKLVAVHMTTLTDEEIDIVATKRASVVHCPSSNLKLASGFCPVSKLDSKGVNIAIGTDGASSNNTLDMLAETKLAAMLAKNVAKDAEVVPARLALRMATLNGAKALGLESVCGSLTPGKSADMIAVQVNSGPEVWPAPSSTDFSAGFDPVTHLIYSSTRNQVADVWVAGKALMRNRRLSTLNLSKLQKSSASWGDKITEFIKKKKTEDKSAES